MIKKKWISTAIAATFSFSLLFSMEKGVEANEPDLAADSAILVEAETGKVIYNKEADVILPPASMTKIMTEYLVNEAVANGDISWDDEVDISDKVIQISQDYDLSNVPLREDISYTAEELYDAMAIYSANGATIALAEHVAGSESNFVDMMNEKAEELGMTEYELVNSTGLNNESMNGLHPEGTAADAENMMSARAMAILTYHLLDEYPQALEVASTTEKTFKEESANVLMENWNWMLPGSLEEQLDYEGVDGLKTGYTDLAGNAFTGTVERDGTRYISVVMRTDTRMARFEETAKLYDYGYNDFSSTEVIEDGETFDEVSSLPVIKGKEDSVSVSAGENLSVLIEDGNEDNITPSIQIDEELLNEDGELEAPLEEGTTVGTVGIDGQADSEYLKDEMASSQEVPLVLDEEVEKAGWLALTARSIGGFFGSMWNSASSFVTGLF
ncbi:D-alanyl-D-alanine carboxypeptidase (penicillin-binding protein 5/6) [Salibacterium salarium]|uniref:D-alanyl-D-alanine carboxypeptidase family protein n=1 Tax=Salibacterium salarium TaxID=284579 RepID=UPI00278A35D0|nr:D-alanyl-D-alanine carboxypeptidase family protein [Salibacterium salarium]MDQ0297616.1 D-alanyl-D-alanine carboxypeptidase (penicillin-binding protein 5/6) [Salibacterium salarium]